MRWLDLGTKFFGQSRGTLNRKNNKKIKNKNISLKEGKVQLTLREDVDPLTHIELVQQKVHALLIDTAASPHWYTLAHAEEPGVERGVVADVFSCRCPPHARVEQQPPHLQHTCMTKCAASLDYPLIQHNSSI